jgi:hypothetical protein
LVSKILLGYEEALWPKQLEISHASQILTNYFKILFFSKLSNYYLKKIWVSIPCSDAMTRIHNSFTKKPSGAAGAARAHGPAKTTIIWRRAAAAAASYFAKSR